MKINNLFFATATLCSISLNLYAGPEVQRLLTEYSHIETVSCSMRRTVDGAAGKIKFISRIYYSNQDKLHVDNLSPVKRRTIADGKRLFQYAPGDPKGFSRPISDLSEQMLISLRKVPGTAMDHLLRMKEMKENALPAESGFRRIGIDTGRNYAVLSLDSQNRLAGVTYFKTADMKEKSAEYTYTHFKEVIDGVWIPFTHEARTTQPQQITETIHIDQFTANKPVAESLFIADNFFSKDIDFVDEFAKIYTE